MVNLLSFGRTLWYDLPVTPMKGDFMFSHWNSRWSQAKSDLTAYQREMLHPCERDWKYKSFINNSPKSKTGDDPAVKDQAAPALPKGRDGP